MEEEILQLYEVQYSDLLTLLSGQNPATIDETERLELISKSIMQNLGRDGPGLLSVNGVPKARNLAQTLLPLARELALLDNDDRKRILKVNDHNLGSDVSLKNLDRIVSSFAMQMKYDQDFNFKISGEVDVGEFKDLGFAFRELGFCMMELGLSFARLCDKLIGGSELQQSLLQGGTAKGRLIHYHSVTDNIAIKKAVTSKLDDAGDLSLWQQWHYDYGIFTILTSPMFMLSDENNECESPSGHTYLQVFHPEASRVLMVKASKGSFIVQVAESADVLSKGRLRATLHSVCRPVEMDNLSRETFVVFLQPAWSKIFSLSDYPDLTVVDRDFDSEKESNGLSRKIREIVPPLFSRLRDGMSFAEFSRETTKQYYGGSGLQSNR
ncbi:hypothetical protein PHJA_002889000 [Phtheirospermum japonicum]|uniref:Isopenicillin N synthase-like Fe(2+) 2OG dioxygenase domain-containing protein n=1 Tax=Phtheirospermum japonicum TaxID=374723 RepID=A0A830DCL4_9LAMI|nr:hypothetical protein PHJA_002889000 [Phtheirospermum japonicum]